MKEQKTVGVLGGMGPYATLMFFKNILHLTEAQKDWEHVHLVIDNNTSIPSRSRAILFNEASPFESMFESCKRLQQYPVDMIAVPCNSAQYWIPDLQKKINIQILSSVYVATKALFERFACKKVAALGGYVTYKKELFRSGLENFGIEHASISKNLQDKVMSIIEKVKLFNPNSHMELQKDYLNLIQEIIDSKHIDGLILGCTEFSYFKDIELLVPFVDSSTELARLVVDYANNIRYI